MLKKLTAILMMMFISTYIFFSTNDTIPVFAEGEGFTVTYHSGDGGEFEDGSKTNAVTYTPVYPSVKQYSHTANIDDTGKKNSNYANSANTNDVVTIPGATNLTVELYYNGESVSYDWVSVWSGSHPTYTASGNRTSTGYVTTANGAPDNNNKFGGSQSGSFTVNGNSLTSMGHCTLTISGDTVTFGFKSDGGGVGQGYGYYTIVTGTDENGNVIRETEGEKSEIAIASGSYKEPTGYAVDGTPYRFKEWNTAADGSGTAVNDPSTLTVDTDLYAIYEMDTIANGTYGCPWYISSAGDLVIGKNEGDCTLNSAASYSDWPWYENRSAIRSARFVGHVSGGTSMAGFFYDQSNNTNIDFSNIDTSQVLDMNLMFFRCSKLTSINLSSFDTSSVTNMSGIFNGCTTLKNLDISSFNTSNVINMSGMFLNCWALTSLNLSHFDTSNVTDMSSMFSYCQTLTTLNIKGFDTSNVTDMAYMFDRCRKLTSISYVANFDTSKVTNMKGMFGTCDSLTYIPVSNFDTSNVTDMAGMFSGCSKLTSIDLTHFDTANVTDMGGMFSACEKITSLAGISNFDTSKVTNMGSMFYKCSKLQQLDVSNFNTENVTNMAEMFRLCGVSSAKFSGVSNFNTANVTSMKYMFGNSNLSQLDLSNFDTRNVTDMTGMFYECLALRQLDLPNFNTENVTSMQYMFYRTNIEKLDLSSFNTTKVTNMNSMFRMSASLTTLNLSSFDTSNVTDMGNMFASCSKLKSVLLPATFSFTGKNITTAAKKATLNNPTSPSTGWKRIYDANNMVRDNSDAIYTAAQLRDQWDPSTMAGLWVWDTEDMSSSGYGDSTKIHSVDPNWRQLNEDTWVYKFNVFDDTLPYYVTEDILPGFISDIPADPGYIVTNNKEATITNTTTTERGALTVTKTVDGEADPNDEFDFTLTFSGPGIGGTQIISDVVFTDGVGHFKLKGGETKVFNGLNEGVTYSVEEEELFDYETESSNAEGIITKEGCIAAFVNTPITTLPEQPGWPHDNNTASLTVFKDVVDPYGSANGEYTFTVELMGLDANATYAYTLTDVSDVTSALLPFETDAQGDATLILTLGDHEYLQFGALPEGARFRVTEDGGNYINSYVINSAGNIIRNNDRAFAKDNALSTQLETIDASMLGSNSEITFTNTYDEYRDLVITKHIDGNTNARFEFTVSLRGLTPNAAYNSSIGRIVADDEGEAEKTFYLAKDESVTIEKLPVGTEYSVEESASVFIASYAINGSEPVASDAANKALSTGWNELSLAEATNVDFTNTVETASLKLKKVVVDGDTTDNNKEFEFTITLKNGLGTEESRPMPVAGEFAYTGSKEGTITFDNSGRGTVTLKHNQQIEILELPVGTIYTIEEADYSADDFVLSEKTNDSGAIVSGGVESQFTNAKESKATLTISKTVFGNTASKDKEFNFTITLKDKQNANVNGEFNYSGTKQGTLTFEDGVATIRLAHNDSITIADLPAGGKYTIAEDDYTADGYSVVHTNTSGTLTKAGITSTFQNINDTHLPTGMYIDRNAAAAGMLFGMATLWIVLMAVRRKLNKA